MTLKELIMKVDFDRIRPYLEDFEAEHLDSIYTYREAYDTLRDMEPDRESHGRIKISWNGGTENGEGKWLNVSGIHVNWEAALNYDIVIADNVRLPLEELAMHCLWEITFWGFSPEEEFETYKRKHDFPKTTNEYEVALMKLRESIWKHQVRRKSSCKKTNDPQYRVLTLPDLPMAPMNGPKQKRAQRQKKRTQRLKGLAARENLIRALTANGSSLHRNDVDFLLNVNCGTKYDYTSATHNISSRLNYILESITKYQHLALDRYNNAIIHIRVSSHYPLSEQEFEKFKTGTRAYLDYEDIIFGTTVTDDRTPKIKVTILLNLREEAKKSTSTYIIRLIQKRNRLNKENEAMPYFFTSGNVTLRHNHIKQKRHGSKSLWALRLADRHTSPLQAPNLSGNQRTLAGKQLRLW